MLTCFGFLNCLSFIISGEREVKAGSFCHTKYRKHEVLMDVFRHKIFVASYRTYRKNKYSIESGKSHENVKQRQLILPTFSHVLERSDQILIAMHEHVEILQEISAIQ